MIIVRYLLIGFGISYFLWWVAGYIADFISWLKWLLVYISCFLDNDLILLLFYMFLITIIKFILYIYKNFS